MYPYIENETGESRSSHRCPADLGGTPGSAWSALYTAGVDSGVMFDVGRDTHMLSIFSLHVSRCFESLYVPSSGKASSVDTLRHVGVFSYFLSDMGEPLDTNKELNTVGWSNILSGLTGGFTGR